MQNEIRILDASALRLSLQETRKLKRFKICRKYKSRDLTITVVFNLNKESNLFLVSVKQNRISLNQIRFYNKPIRSFFATLLKKKVKQKNCSSGFVDLSLVRLKSDKKVIII